MSSALLWNRIRLSLFFSVVTARLRTSAFGPAVPLASMSSFADIAQLQAPQVFPSSSPENTPQPVYQEPGAPSVHIKDVLLYLLLEAGRVQTSRGPRETNPSRRQSGRLPFPPR